MKFRISYYFAPLSIKTPVINYADLIDLIADILGREEGIFGNNRRQFEKHWPEIREYLGIQIEQTIVHDENFHSFIKNLYDGE
jgi:hypothetical protein